MLSSYGYDIRDRYPGTACFPNDRKEFAVSVSNSSRTARSLEGRTLLLVEDCPDQVRLYLSFLQLAGANVTLECNGQSAVDAVRKSPTHFEAVVMDFLMPKLDGLGATRQLRELGYGGAIIALTAYGTDELKLAWFRAGCDDYLEKPVKKATIIAAILRHTMAVVEEV